MELFRWLGRLNFLDMLYPPSCPVCGDSLDKGVIGILCYECWDNLNFCEDSVCVRCAEPIDELEKSERIVKEPICLDCSHRPPSFDGARSVFFYDEFIKGLILGFKHGDRTDLRFMLASWIANRVYDWVDEVDYIIPVPLHYWRLVGRRYNQSMILAQLVCKQQGAEDKLISDMLVRRDYTKLMKSFTIRQRYASLKKAIKLRDDWRGRLKGKSILVIDDVHTSGATFSACANVLRGGGAERIYVASIARVLL